MLHFGQPDGFIGGPTPQRLDSGWYAGGSVWLTPGLAGVMLTFQWVGVERSPGVYAWADLDREVNWCRSNRLKYILRPVGISYSGARSWVPDDLLAAGQHARDGGGWCPLYRDPTVFTRWKAWISAMGAQYPDAYGVLLEETNLFNFATADPTGFSALGSTGGEIAQCLLMLAHARAAFARAWKGHGYHTNATRAHYDSYISSIAVGGYCYAVNDLLPPGGPAGYQSWPWKYGFMPMAGRSTLSVCETASWNGAYTPANATLLRDFAKQMQLDHLVWSCIGGAAGPCWAATKPMIGT